MNFKEASGEACGIWLKLRLHKDMATFQTLQTLIGHVAMFEKFAISFSNLNFSQFEHVTTHYQTKQAWIGLNITRYYNLNALPPHALPLIFSEICLVLGYLQRFTTHYCRFFFKKSIFFYKFDGNA